eukprot:scaffold70477_cov51-Cyclotella_meneghiniana.AAC.1
MAGLIERIGMMQLVQPDDMMTAMGMIVTPWVEDGPWLMEETWLLIAAWSLDTSFVAEGEDDDDDDGVTTYCYVLSNPRFEHNVTSAYGGKRISHNINNITSIDAKIFVSKPIFS